MLEEEKGDTDGQQQRYLPKMKIDPVKLKQAFFANFLKQYFEQGVLKFP